MTLLILMLIVCFVLYGDIFVFIHIKKCALILILFAKTDDFVLYEGIMIVLLCSDMLKKKKPQV